MDCRIGIIWSTHPEQHIFPSIPQRADAVKQLPEGFGNMGVESLLDLLRKRFWWPSMRKDDKLWLKACPMCQINQRKDRAHHDEMHRLDVPAAFHRWFLDFIGELATSLKGNRWILVAVDYTTNWPIARTVPTASAEAVADFIYEEIDTFWVSQGNPNGSGWKFYEQYRKTLPS